MSVFIVSSPVVYGTFIENVFAGDKPVNYVFKRQDTKVQSVGIGASSKILVTFTSPLDSSIVVGSSIYISSGDYDESGEVLAVTTYTITLNINWFEDSTGGYINWKKNWYFEVNLVNVDNTLINTLPFTLRDDGDEAGNITIDVSIVNDLNKATIPTSSGEITDERTKFYLQYREAWEDNTSGSYTTYVEEIIIVYASEQMEIEEFSNDLDLPPYYTSYDTGIIFTHSNYNDDSGKIGIEFYYDELDINQLNVTTDNFLSAVTIEKYGFIYCEIPSSLVLDSTTEYLKIKAEYTAALPDFSPLDFSSDFDIT